MGKTCGSSNFLAFASRMIRFCLVAAIGPMCQKTAAQTTAVTTTLRTLITSPVWNELEQTLYFIEGIDPKSLIKYNPHKTTNKDNYVKIDSASVLKFVVPVITQKNTTKKWAIGSGNVVGLYEWDGATTQLVSAVSSLKNAFTDENEAIECGKSDARNRLWVGTSFAMENSEGMETLGKLSSVDAAGTVTKKRDLLNPPGGIAWSTGSLSIYYSDTKEKNIMESSFNLTTGMIGNDAKVIFDFKLNKVDGIPAGMTMDNAGFLWVACRQTNKVIKIKSSTGELLRTLDIPEVSSVTSVAFGGDNLQDLYVTTEANTISEKTLKSGSLFVVSDTESNGIHLAEIDAEWPA